MRDSSDVELVEACRRGEEAAWREIFRRYLGLVRSACAQAGARGPDVGDRAQDVFGEFVRSIHVLREPKALPRWFTTASRRITLRAIRIDRRFSAEVPEDLMDTGRDPEAAYVALEERHRLERALENLDHDCQVIVRSLYLSEPPSTYAQVARKLGVAENGIGSMRQRCRGRLRRLLEEE